MEIAPIEPSSFAQFQIEQDRTFYAVFPDARPKDEWPSQNASFYRSEFERGSESEAYQHDHISIPIASSSSVSYAHNIKVPKPSPILCKVSPAIQRDCATRRSSHSPIFAQHEVIICSILVSFYANYILSPFPYHNNYLVRHLRTLRQATMTSPHTSFSTYPFCTSARPSSKL